MHVILDYGLGNTASVLKAVQAAGCIGIISRDPEVLRQSSTIILPGVGSFRDAMERLHTLKLVPLLNELVIEKKKRFLGICLGMQLLGEIGYEDGETKGLGWIKGEIKKIPSQGQRIPHMGWNDVKVVRADSLGPIIDPNFYFMHSFYFDADPSAITSLVHHGSDLTATVQSNNIYGAQFHPEKSQSSGLAYLTHVLGHPC
jgi:imidazole glycerol-phosphate synthase subunit HisH